MVPEGAWDGGLGPRQCGRLEAGMLGVIRDSGKKSHRAELSSESWSWGTALSGGPVPREHLPEPGLVLVTGRGTDQDQQADHLPESRAGYGELGKGASSPGKEKGWVTRSQEMLKSASKANLACYRNSRSGLSLPETSHATAGQQLESTLGLSGSPALKTQAAGSSPATQTQSLLTVTGYEGKPQDGGPRPLPWPGHQGECAAIVLRLGSRAFLAAQGLWGPQALSRSDPEPALPKSCVGPGPGPPAGGLSSSPGAGGAWQRPPGTRKSERQP